MFEAILKPSTGEKRPYLVFLLGYLYGILSFVLASLVFQEDLGMVLVLLTVMFSLPLIYSIIQREAKKHVSSDSEKVLLREHRKAVVVYLSLFLGFTLAFASLFIAVKPDKLYTYFSDQIDTLNSINSEAIRIQGYSIQMKVNSFFVIFLNNLRVTIFCILFSLIFGAGAIFILSWNGSVLGVALGDFVKQRLVLISAGEAAGVAHYLASFSSGILRYFVHGVPEITAYIIAGIAGGIISFAVIKHSLFSKKFESVVVDCANLIMIAIVFLLGASFIEVFITPFFF
ncbi:MAG: hypothetical protein PWQ28_569 [Candidatus Woesearchaeota archaeon]|nr:hypothetical protein [Candidatus Woesearchaeota archaeon]